MQLTAVPRALSLVAATFVIASCSSADGPGGGKAFTNSIVFVSDRSGEQQLYTMKADGSRVKQLTTAIGAKYSPAFSPDGRRIAFAMTDTASGSLWLYVVNADGTGLTQLTSGFEHDFDPSWSPDGSQIVFTSDHMLSVYYAIYLMNSDGSGLHALVADTALNVSPSWSPNTNEILFARDFEGRVYETTSAGDSLKFLVGGSQPEWSPSGTQFLFDCGPHVCVSRTRDATAIDTIVRDVNFVFQYVSRPTWSPDEHRFAYVTTTGRSGAPVSIWSASTTDGSGVVQLTPDSAGRSWAPDWSRH